MRGREGAEEAELGLEDEDESEGEEGGSGRGSHGQASLQRRALARRMGLRSLRATHMPLFLHSRTLIVKKAGEDGVRVTAPLPGYMQDVFTALGWPLPEA